MPSDQLLSATEAAARLGIPKRTLLWRAEHGHLDFAQKLPGHNGAYLFDPAEIDALLDRLTTEAGAA